jgi:Na+/phosphate symporter
MIAIATCILGLILYLVSKDGKPTRVGEIMFFLGLAFSLWQFGGKSLL